MERSDNVIMFPNLAEKLLHKGMAALEEKSYRDALSYFKQVVELQAENAEAYFGLVVAYMELGHIEEAVEVSNTMLLMGLGDYYELVQIHITMLIQLGRFTQARDMLEALFIEQKVPSQHVEALYRLLHISRQMTDSSDEDEQTAEVVAVDLQLIVQFFDGSISEQLQAFQSLSKQVEKEGVLTALLQYLNEEEQNPFIQSMVLQLLKEIKYEEQVTINKFGESMIVNPTMLEDFFTWQLPQQLVTLIDEKISHDNPSLADYMKQLVWQYYFMVFPFESKNADTSLLLAGFEVVASERIGYDMNEHDLARKYEVSVQKLLDIVDRIESVEMQGFEGFEQWEN